MFLFKHFSFTSPALSIVMKRRLSSLVYAASSKDFGHYKVYCVILTFLANNQPLILTATISSILKDPDCLGEKNNSPKSSKVVRLIRKN